MAYIGRQKLMTTKTYKYSCCTQGAAMLKTSYPLIQSFEFLSACWLLSICWSLFVLERWPWQGWHPSQCLSFFTAACLVWTGNSAPHRHVSHVNIYLSISALLFTPENMTAKQLGNAIAANGRPPYMTSKQAAAKFLGYSAL